MKESQKKISGEFHESWMEYVDEYLEIYREYNLTPPHRPQFLHNLLRIDAKRYFLDKIGEYATSFQQDIQMLEEKYNSAVRHTRVKNCLNSLRVNDFVVQGKEMLVALNLTSNSSMKISGRSPRSLSGDAHNG